MTDAPLLWMDLEMTGLDPAEDRILEVAAIVTDWDLEEVAGHTAVVRVDPALIDRRMVGEFWDAHDDVRRALAAQNEDGRDASLVEDELLGFVAEHCGERPVLAGNSIHQDRRFVRREWPRLDAALHYRMLDVSSFKVVFAGRELGSPFRKREAHRALDDIRESIAELEHYLSGLPPPAPTS